MRKFRKGKVQGGMPESRVCGPGELRILLYRR